MGDKGLRQVFLDAAKSIARRILDAPISPYGPGVRCKVRRTVVLDKAGSLLRGSVVELTGARDQKDRLQVRVIDLPDHEWKKTGHLPYGPGFVLFVPESVLEALDD